MLSLGFTGKDPTRHTSVQFFSDGQSLQRDCLSGLKTSHGARKSCDTVPIHSLVYPPTPTPGLTRVCGESHSPPFHAALFQVHKGQTPLPVRRNSKIVHIATTSYPARTHLHIPYLFQECVLLCPLLRKSTTQMISRLGLTFLVTSLPTFRDTQKKSALSLDHHHRARHL